MTLGRKKGENRKERAPVTSLPRIDGVTLALLPDPSASRKHIQQNKATVPISQIRDIFTF